MFLIGEWLIKMAYNTILWGIGVLVILVIFLSIGKSYFVAGEKKDKISKTFSTFYSPSIFTLVVSLRTLAISDFTQSNKPIELILEHLYFLFAISIMLNLLNLIVIESETANATKKHFLFYITLIFNTLSFCLWLVIAYMMFDIL